MLYYLYDKTFDGLLTCVFEAFSRKQQPDKIVSGDFALPMFSEAFTVITDEQKSERVSRALAKKLSRSAMEMLAVCYLAEMAEVEMAIFRYASKAVVAPASIEMNFADEDVLYLSKIYKKVTREEERMRQFVRFQKTADGMFFAVMEPLCNVLPLTAKYFQSRFADQQWIIYDARRRYGLYYDLQKVETVSFDNPETLINAANLPQDKLDSAEIDFQNLWKDYLAAITIRERHNPRLQQQFMPKRFWKYLVEKK
ncbi:MAG: TIGR03915 family putative DNA repair protein [Paludibacter sp.]|jgi:probable DNA metabolism protein|nr:TIGR03915 family putative DNA repair protein [Paludibacter sp.]